MEMKILASAAEPGMTLWNGKVITDVQTNPTNGQTRLSYQGQKNGAWFLRDHHIVIRVEES